MGIQLHMATVNTCNARCHFCVYPKPENNLPKGVMDMALYRKIIDEAQGIPEIDCIAFSALGEPLLDRHLVERVAYARRARPDWTPFEVYTNGTYLTPAKFDALRDAGLDSLTVSLNATNPKQHEKIMGIKGQFGKIVQNIKYAIANSQGKVDVIVKAVRNQDFFDEVDQVKFHMQWGIRLAPDVYPGHGQVVLEANWAGGNRLLEERKKILDPNSECGRAVGQISILWDGKVTMCCFDPLNTFPLGDLKTQTIKEIYNSKKYTDFRLAHFENRAAEYDLCAKCTRI